MKVGIGTGNPGVFQGYPHPYPRKPVPVPRVWVSTGTGTGFAKTRGVYNPCTGMPPKPTEKPRNSSAGVN